MPPRNRVRPKGLMGLSGIVETKLPQLMCDPELNHVVSSDAFEKERQGRRAFQKYRVLFPLLCRRTRYRAGCFSLTRARACR